MNALKALKPNPWIKGASVVGAMIVAEFGGVMVGRWWHTSFFTTVTLASVSGMLLLCALKFYTWRTRSDADAGGVDLQSGRQRLPINPPCVAEWLVALIMPKRGSDGLLGDLAERFHRHVEMRGLRRAQALYWAEALRSIGPILLAKAKKLGLIAVVAEIWRRTHL